MSRDGQYNRIASIIAPLTLKEKGTGAEIQIPSEKGGIDIGHLFLEFGGNKIQIRGNPAVFTKMTERLEEAGFTVYFLDTKEHYGELENIGKLLEPECHLWRFSDMECGEICCHRNEANNGELVLRLGSKHIELRGSFSCNADGIPYGYEEAVKRLRAAGYEVEVDAEDYLDCGETADETDWDETDCEEDTDTEKKVVTTKVSARHWMYFLLRGLGGVLLFLSLLATFGSWIGFFFPAIFCAALVMTIIGFVVWSPEKAKYSKRKETGWREVVADANEQWFFWSVIYLSIVGLLLLYSFISIFIG